MFEFVLRNKDKIKEFLKSKEREIAGIQGILFFRLPVQFAILVLTTNLTLLLVKKFRISCYSIIALLLLLRILWNTFSIGKICSKFFFPENVPTGNQDETNRIRSVDEIYNAIISLFSKLSEYTREKDTPWKQLVFFLSFFILFIYVRTFWIIFIFVNLAFFLPGIIFHPAVYPSFQKALSSVF